MRTRGAWVLGITAVLIVDPALAPIAPAQSPKEGAPVEVAVSPPLAPPGTPVTIAGHTFVDGKRLDVSITVQPPSGAALKLTATANVKTGSYSTSFANTTIAGEYRVTVTSPDGKGTGKTSFVIASPGSVLSTAAEALNGGMALSASAIGDVKADVAALPPSPASEEVTKKIQAIESQMKELEAPLANVRKAALATSQAAEASADVVNAAKQEFSEVTTWAAEADPELDGIKKRLQLARDRKGSTCDQLELANEALTAVSLALVFTARGVGLLVKLFMNNALPAAINAIPKMSDGSKHTTTEAVKVGVAAGTSYKELVGVSQDLVGDTAQFILKGAFSKYCQKFEGPMMANFDVTFLEGAAPWLKYSVRLDGRIVLRYAKNAPSGQPIRLTGEIEGNATQFTFNENVFVVEPPPKGALILLRKTIPAIPFVNSTKDPLGFGLFARMGTPAYFYVPVEGELVKDRIVLKVMDAKVDFTDLVKNRLVLIFAAPMLPIPLIRTFDFTIEKAKFIISRGMLDAPEFQVTVTGAKQAIDRTFTRNHVSKDGEIKVNWMIVIKATSG